MLRFILFLADLIDLNSCVLRHTEVPVSNGLDTCVLLQAQAFLFGDCHLIALIMPVHFFILIFLL